jgi:hypothetical protein
MEDMQAAAAELAAGEANDEDLDGEDGEISSQTSDDGEVGGDGPDGEWVDDEDGVGTTGRKKKVFSCIDKVRHSSQFAQRSSNRRINIASCCRGRYSLIRGQTQEDPSAHSEILPCRAPSLGPHSQYEDPLEYHLC